MSTPKITKTKRGYAKRFTGQWLGVSYTMALTAWSNMTGLHRSYMEHRVKRGHEFQNILDKRAPVAWRERNKFLYNK